MGQPHKGQKGNAMTIKDYTTAALRFSTDSANWGSLDPYKFYTTGSLTTHADWWAESCDNAVGGLDISWAFHESVDAIHAEAPQRFIDQISAQLEQLIDESADAQQLAALLDLMR